MIDFSLYIGKDMLIKKKPNELLDGFLEEYNLVEKINVGKARDMISKTLKYYNTKEPNGCYTEELESKWYDDLERGKTNYSLYNTKYYFTDLWCCWKIYSRIYLRTLIQENGLNDCQTIKSGLGRIRCILDLGCGIGYTTASLKQIFKGANVYGTNIEGTGQWKFCKHMSKKYSFNLIPNISKIKAPVDLVFASEYFEHIENATDHLLDIIDTLSPKYFYVANSFGTHAIGHFREYRHGKGTLFPCSIPHKKISRRFNLMLATQYERLKINAWNNKPALWKRKTG